MDGAALPSPNFDKKASSGFLPFSSTPVQSNHFKPKWGKKNRADNWTRFGQSQGEDQASSPSTRSPGYRNSGNFNGDQGWNNQGYQPSPRGCGSPSATGQGGNGSPRGGYFPRFGSPGLGAPRYSSGGGNGGTPRYNSPGGGQNNHRGGGRFNNSWNRSESNGGNNGSGFFHPSMVEDPWRDLERERERRLSSSARSLNSTERLGSSRVEEGEYGSPQTNGISDSMIPQVGDSLLQRNNALNDSEATETGQKDSPYGEQT